MLHSVNKKEKAISVVVTETSRDLGLWKVRSGLCSRRLGLEREKAR